jgi:glycosyltransferase involved in cell wall biosynthesis
MLMRELSMNKEYGVQPELTFERSDNFHLREIEKSLDSGLKRQRHFINVRSGYSNALTHGPIRALSSLYAGGTNPVRNVDIFHATFYRPTPWERRVAKKLVVTVHDFIPEKLGWTGLRNPHLGKKKLVNDADKIICVSNATADDLKDFYNVDEAKISIVAHGVETSILKVKTFSERLQQEPYVLYVGHRGGYKNFSILVEAMELLKSKKVGLKLYIAGPALEPSERDSLDQKLGSSGWKQFSAPADGKLAELYSGALLHCVTSTMEGFGMTILESMSYSTPVIASQIPVFREVGGNAASYFDLGNPEHLAALILQHLDENYFSSKMRLSIRWANLNSWSKSAATLAGAYHSIE